MATAKTDVIYSHEILYKCECWCAGLNVKRSVQMPNCLVCVGEVGMFLAWPSLHV